MTKDLRYYLELKYPVLISEGSDSGKGYFEAEIPELPGCGSFGETIEEALSRLASAKEIWIRARLKRNLPIPKPLSEEDFSGRLLLRITPGLHKNLAEAARGENLSLNQHIRNVLETSTSQTDLLERLKRFEQKLDKIGQALENPKTSAVAYNEAASSNWGFISHMKSRATAVNWLDYPQSVDKEISQVSWPALEVKA